MCFWKIIKLTFAQNSTSGTVHIKVAKIQLNGLKKDHFTFFERVK